MQAHFNERVEVDGLTFNSSLPSSSIAAAMKTVQGLLVEQTSRDMYLSTLILLAAIMATSYLISAIRLQSLGPKAPRVGSGWFWESRIIANARFFLSSRKMLDDGYSRFKDRIFWFARNDADMIVIPNKYIDEIRALPAHVANATQAHAHNLLGRFTDMNLITESDLHFRMIQTKLTPNLAQLVGPMQQELEWGLKLDFPECQDHWQTMKPYHTILGLVARMSASVFVGRPYCRNEIWLELSKQFTENVFKSLLVMRSMPTWTHPFLYWLLPTRWANARYIRAAQKLLRPEILRRQQLVAEGKHTKADATLLGWMVECAQGFEKEPARLAHMEIIISLASIHTTQMNAVHCVLDLAARPQYLQPLRDEIQEAIKADGGFKKSTFTRLRKLDSFLKESQRFSPPSLLSYHRLMLQDHTLSDGTFLPKDAHICMAVNNIQNDPANTPNPKEFDPFRYERMRRQPGEELAHQFVTTTNQSLNFGHGKYACPGRFFAAMEIKSIMMRLIMNYDFRLPDGTGRPKNMDAYEFIFPNPDATVEIRERPKEEQVDFRVIG